MDKKSFLSDNLTLDSSFKSLFNLSAVVLPSPDQSCWEVYIKYPSQLFQRIRDIEDEEKSVSQEI